MKAQTVNLRLTKEDWKIMERIRTTEYGQVPLAIIVSKMVSDTLKEIDAQ